MKEDARDSPKIGFIGAGLLGTVLAIGLGRAGYSLVAVASRRYDSAQRLAAYNRHCVPCKTPQEVADIADLVFVTTPDDTIQEIIEKVRWISNQGVVHCSGALSLDALEAARGQGAHIGSFHPLQSFAGVEEALESLPGTTFVLEGQGSLLGVLKGLATALKGEWVALRPEDKVLYHIAGVLASNYLVALAGQAVGLWEEMGQSKDGALKALMPLVKGTVRNLEAVGLPGALTGPVARGDIGTLRKHLKALAERIPDLVPLYCQLGLAALPLAQAKGRVNPEEGVQMERLFQRSLGSAVITL